MKQFLSSSVDLICISMSENSMSIIVNTPDMGDEIIKAFCDCVVRIVEEYKSLLNAVVAVSDPCDNLELLAILSKKTQTILSCRILDETIEVLRNSDIKKRLEKHFDFSQHVNVMSNALSVGNYDVFVNALDEAFAQLLQNKMPFYIYTDLTDRVYQAMKEIAQTKKILIEADLIKKGDIYGSIDYIKTVAFKICESSETVTDDRNKKILDYIDENISKDLYLEGIAETFSLTPTYFSRYFKEITGVNFLKYVTQKKIEFAKKLLLENPKLQINDIATMTGFTSLSVFARTFKKYEGVSPTVYKEIHLK